MLVKTKSIKLNGINHTTITVETEITTGIGIHLVGLADKYVKESLLRTVTALQAKGYRIPGKKIVINLAPADLCKSGSGYDLAIAAGIIAASGQEDLTGMDNTVILGELGLDGTIRPVSGEVQAFLAAMEDKSISSIIIPKQSAQELHDIFHLDEHTATPVYGVSDIDEMIQAIQGKLEPVWKTHTPRKKNISAGTGAYAKLSGSPTAQRAAEIAAAGGHHMIVIGAPGTGKAITAAAVAELLPPMSFDETVEAAKIYSTSGRLGLLTDLAANGKRPLRMPPGMATSLSSLLGGGTGDNIMPGEVSLASGGILYIDKFIELSKAVTDALRGPLEDKKVVISRLRSKVEFPARFRLVASSEPCPCGYYGTGDRCICTPGQRAAFLSRLSGPVMDKIDLQLFLNGTPGADESARQNPIEEVRDRVRIAIQRQKLRFGFSGRLNADMTSAEIIKYCKTDPFLQALIENLIDKLGLSARAYTRILKIARTIADLDGREVICSSDITEAASFRFLDRTPSNS